MGSKQRQRIGFIMRATTDRHQGEMLAGVVDAAIKHDIDVVRITLDIDYNFDRQNDQVYNRLEFGCRIADNLDLDGLLHLGWSGRTQRVKELLKKSAGIPIVTLGVGENDFISVYQKGDEYVEELVSHLVREHHYKKIAFIEPVVEDSRVDIYSRKLKSFNLFDPDYIIPKSEIGIIGNLGFDDRAARIVSYIYDIKKLSPDVIMSMFSEEAVLIIENLKARGLRVPEDVAVTSWEESDLCRFNDPPITTVYYPFYEVGYTGCEILVKLLSGEKTEQLNVVPGRVFFRKSCGCTTSTLDKARSWGVSPVPDIPVFTDADAEHKIHTELQNRLLVIKADEIYFPFRESLEKKNPEIFIAWFENKLKSIHLSVEQLYSIRDDLFTFRKEMMRFLSNNSDLSALAEHIWLNIHIITGNWIEKKLSTEERFKVQYRSKVQEIGLDLITTFNLDKVWEILNANLSRMNIPQCFIYRIISPESSEMATRLLYKYQDNTGTGVNVVNPVQEATEEESVLHGPVFDLDLLFKEKRHTYIFNVLRIRDMIIGCVFFEYGVEDDRIYLTLSVELSSAIHGSLVLRKLREANSELVTAQNEILKQMDIINSRTKELEELNRKLFDLDTLKNDFIANITHDFRSPLMIILNNIDLALKYDPEMSDKGKKRLNVIYESSLKLKATIDRLLDLAKMDAQGVRIRVRCIRIKKFLSSISDFYRSAVLNTKIKVVNLFDTQEIDIWTDPEKLEEVLNNLISNSMKFIDPENGEIVISLEETDDAVRICISDNGIGIPKDKLERIFRRFEQVETGKDRIYKGTGIGLAFSKQLITYLKGTIRAESGGLGKGARFIISLKKGREHFNNDELAEDTGPVLPEDHRRSEFRRIIETEMKERLGKIHITTMFRDLNKDNEFEKTKGIILVVDDNQQIREIVVEYLSNNGYMNFILAEDGLQGVDVAYQYRPDLVICDYNMPKMRGDQFHNELIENPDFKKIPFIFLTAVADKNIILERKKKGAVAYLSKPVEESDLILTVELHMSKFMELKATMYQATIDELTHINNKRNLMKLVRNQLSIRKLRDISFVFIDLDHFKSINDTYGHPVGDKVLAEVGDVIRDTLRQYDIAGRYGGEEFLLVLPETGEEQSVHVAEKLMSRIKELRIACQDTEIRFTASFGISSLFGNRKLICEKLDIPDLDSIFTIDAAPETDWESITIKKLQIPELLISYADKAMYLSKRTTCGKCLYHSGSSIQFAGSKCPKCGSSDIITGRDKITIFTDADA